MSHFRPIRIGILAALFLTSCGGALLPAGSQSQPNHNATPTPTATPNSQLNFFSFGDWGTGTQSQLDVADAVEVYCQAKHCDFGLLLGDNFYDHGVSATDDPQWQSKFETVYSFAGPFYVVLGNHDYEGNPQAEVDYTFLQNRWQLPARHYSVKFPANAANPLLEIFVIDSNAFDAAAAADLQASLQASTATWKLLALHHPIYSNGPHGDDSAGINSSLIPIICQSVDLVLAGHDHLFSHLDEPADGCAFPQFVVGTGGRTLYTANPDPRALFSDASFGFAGLQIDPHALRVEFHHTDGSVPYSFELQK